MRYSLSLSPSLSLPLSLSLSLSLLFVVGITRNTTQELFDEISNSNAIRQLPLDKHLYATMIRVFVDHNEIESAEELYR